MSIMGRGPLSVVAIGLVILVILGMHDRKQDANDMLYPRKDYSQDVSKIYHDLGCWQLKRKNYKRAIKTFLYALQESPDSLELHDQLGMAYECDGDKTRALTTYFRAMARHERFSDVRFGHYEDEPFVQPSHHGALLLGSREAWKGQVLLDKSLLVYTPESDADTIMLLRFIPDVARRIGRVVLVVKPSLVRLCKELEWDISNLEIADTSSGSTTLPLCQCHVALSQVPAYLNCTYESISRRAAYLKPEQYVVEKFHDTLFAKNSSLKVGIALGSSKGVYKDISILNSALIDALSQTSGAMFYFLPTFDVDKNDKHAVLKTVGHIKMSMLKLAGKCVDVQNFCHDWADVAAVVAHCDVIIGFDNAVMHLAGALGKKAVMLLPEVADWRWLNLSEDLSSVWYKGMTKFCKKESFTWESLITRALHVALAEQKKHSVKL